MRTSILLTSGVCIAFFGLINPSIAIAQTIGFILGCPLTEEFKR